MSRNILKNSVSVPGHLKEGVSHLNALVEGGFTKLMGRLEIKGMPVPRAQRSYMKIHL